MGNYFTVEVTAGAIVEQDGKILIVQEKNHPGRPGPALVLTQPSGHMEDNEDIFDALKREVLEETGYTVEPDAFLGIYTKRWPDKTAIRFSFVCRLTGEPRAEVKDKYVTDVLWMTPEEIRARKAEFRMGATENTFQDYFAGKRYPLEMVQYIRTNP
jgi:8-oxo-dGTP pyrophosphatase MutT (NUDIX family)